MPDILTCWRCGHTGTRATFTLTPRGYGKPRITCRRVTACDRRYFTRLALRR